MSASSIRPVFSRGVGFVVFPTSTRSLRTVPGSSAVTIAVPTRTASKPAPATRVTSAASEMALSAPAMRSIGSSGANRRACSTSTSMVSRFRLLMPTMPLPDSTADTSSSGRWNSTRASRPTECAASTNSLRAEPSRSSAINSTALAPAVAARNT